MNKIHENFLVIRKKYKLSKEHNIIFNFLFEKIKSFVPRHQFQSTEDQRVNSALETDIKKSKIE
jgi:hypothetical protein